MKKRAEKFQDVTSSHLVVKSVFHNQISAIRLRRRNEWKTRDIILTKDSHAVR